MCSISFKSSLGGSGPVIWSYFAEFQPKSRRGSMLSFMAAFWTIGNLFVAGMAWIIIPSGELHILNHSIEQQTANNYLNLFDSIFLPSSLYRHWLCHTILQIQFLENIFITVCIAIIFGNSVTVLSARESEILDHAGPS